jgi:large subunit ribosomal protein L25
MASTTSNTKLDITAREAAHSREVRRLRRAGRVPGVLYGRDKDPLPFEVGERELRHALAGSGAVIELSLDGGSGSEAAVVKDLQRHPVRGEVMHVDLLRVDLDQAIQTAVGITLVGGEDAPGVAEGGVLSSPISELNIEAKPEAIPDTIEVDVSKLEAAGTLTLADVPAPAGVTFLDDPEATIVATITAPTPVEEETDEVEAETEVVGEGAGEAEGSDEDPGADEVPAADGGE